MTDYKHKSITKLSELFRKHKAEMSEGLSFTSMLWKAVSPSVPELLKALDEDEEMLDKIKNFLKGITEAMDEDAVKAEGEESAKGDLP